MQYRNVCVCDPIQDASVAEGIRLKFMALDPVMNEQVVGKSRCWNTKLGALFDRLKNNRLGYRWTTGFYSQSATTFEEVYHNCKNRGEEPPDPADLNRLSVSRLRKRNVY